VFRKRPKLTRKGTKAAAAQPAATAAEAITAAVFEGTKRLAAEFESFSSGALTMALAYAAAPGNPLREC
jgi:hypothetical protein